MPPAVGGSSGIGAAQPNQVPARDVPARLVPATGEDGDGFRLRRSARFPGLRRDFPKKIYPAAAGDLAAHRKIVYVIQVPGGTGDASPRHGAANEINSKSP